MPPSAAMRGTGDGHGDRAPGHRGRAGAVSAAPPNGPTVRDILGHLGEPTTPPRIAPARGPPLWAAAATHDPAADRLLQSAPAFEFDQRIAW